MTYEALRARTTPEIAFRFVSNVDPVDLARATRGLDPRETLFVVVSKTMSTLETIDERRAARSGCAGALGKRRRARAALRRRGREGRGGAGDRDPRRERLPLLGLGRGRTSICSAVGLSTMVALGPDGFRSSSTASTRWTSTTRARRSAPTSPRSRVCSTVWYRSFLGAQTTAVVPYATALRLLPAYLQQLCMESLGKRVDATGEPRETDTGAPCSG